MDYLSHNIAINLKRIRKAKGMSLDVVSEQTGVSKSMLATIEKGDANPSIGVLGKIMSGLRIDLQDLTDETVRDQIRENLKEYQGISYKEIAEEAFKSGRKHLATMLLEFESHCSDRVRECI